MAASSPPKSAVPPVNFVRDVGYPLRKWNAPTVRGTYF